MFSFFSTFFPVFIGLALMGGLLLGAAALLVPRLRRAKTLGVIGVAGLITVALPISALAGVGATSVATEAIPAAEIPLEQEPTSEPPTTRSEAPSQMPSPTPSHTSTTEPLEVTPTAPESSAPASSTITTNSQQSRTSAATSATKPPSRTQSRSSPPQRTSTSSSGVYFKNCDAVRAAGKAPLRRGQPGYRSALDADGDGIACEPHWRNTTPKPSKTAKPTTKSQSGSVYYKNCAAVRAAGKAPLHRGQPGYRKALDRDGDGIACE